MKKWEYYLENENEYHTVDVNQLGLKGWELVAVVKNYGVYCTFYFKREIIKP